MREISLLIGGKAGEGINQAGMMLGALLGRLGYRIYVYTDYPSLIRGGHNFSVIRAGEERTGSSREKVDFVLALNQDTVSMHRDKLKDPSHVIFDSGAVKAEGVGIDLTAVIKEKKINPIIRNTGMIGAFARAAGIPKDILMEVIKTQIHKEIEHNIEIAGFGYDNSKELMKAGSLKGPVLPLYSGNEAVGLGLVNGGLDAYAAYPMTPSSSILHFLAEKAQDFKIKVIHPENEIAVMLMACGLAYAGNKAAVGTSGGGFCLMTEGLSLSGIAEIPVVVAMSQRPGPSTGVPTYTGQADLNFILNAGHGEFLRFVTAPGDPEEAFSFAETAMRISWKYQIPSLILLDKDISEGVYSFQSDLVEKHDISPELMANKKPGYKRYVITPDGISPLLFPPVPGAAVKVNSYEHDDDGITTEEAGAIAGMQEKRFRKADNLMKDIDKMDPVRVYGDKSSGTVIVAWGSNKQVCRETAVALGIRFVYPVVLWPFPAEKMKESLKGAKKIICVENNLTGQLAGLLKAQGIECDDRILKYDGRPFTNEELEEAVKGHMSGGAK